MGLVLDVGAWLSIGSGALMALLGLGLLATNPRKDWNRVFALLAVFWGVQIVTVNLVRVTSEPGLARLGGEVSLAFLIPLPFFIASFATIFPRPLPGWRGHVPTLLLLLSATALLALFATPQQLIAELRDAPEGGFTLVWGPLFPSLVVAPLYGALGYALYVMLHRLGPSETAIERRQVSLVLAAFALVVAYNAPTQLVRFGGATGASEAVGAEAALIAAVMLASLVLLVVLAAQLVRSRPADQAARRDTRRVLAAIAAGGVAALLALGAPSLAGTDLDLLGVVRLGSVALIVYAIARYQLFDIDLRVKHGATAGAALVAGLAVAAAAFVLLRRASVAAEAGSAAALVLAAAAFLPALRVSARLADRLAPDVRRGDEHLYLRKLEVYRAAVEDVIRGGNSPQADAPELADLRRKLDLAERDHVLVRSLAQPGAGREPELREGAIVFGRYRVERFLGEGGFGRVFRAHDTALGRDVVIKELQARWRAEPGVVSTFLREARVAGQLRHPNIVAIFDVQQRGPDATIIMEYVPGGTVQDRLARGRLDPEEAARIARGVLAGLAAAHAQGVVHRDVKAGNVLLGPGGEVKLADFGIAQLAGDDDERTVSGLTLKRFQPGTLAAMSPEQARGQPLDARSDIYAAGALLHRMLTGKAHVALAGLDEVAARDAIAAAEPPSMPGVPPALAAVVRRALASHPEERYPSAQAMAQALAEAGAPARRVGA